MLFDEVPSVEIEFRGELIHWRGPSPYHFVDIPEDACHEIEGIAPLVSYGWGVVPVGARIGETEWSTSLFPREGRYLLPVRDSVRHAEALELGDVVSVRLVIQLERPLGAAG
ncbi:MAG TPA: DUF1905 domain-containing protein [Candidatus Limnocylindria bacterium]|nr:DUF1905 domain-containing protein [Candidatus Limnocylindria bacterium]